MPKGSSPSGPSSAFSISGAESGPGEACFEIRVPGDCPYFEGHFEGAPVLPGVAQLALLSTLYRLAGFPCEMSRIPNVGFRAKVLPGDRLHATITQPDSAGRTQFVLRKRERLVSRGTLTVGEETK